MAQRPYEIIAKCVMVGLPGSSDIASLGERLSKSRSHAPGMVVAAPRPPAVFQDGGYVLETRFVAWADDGTGALLTAERVLQAAKIVCSDLYLSGRALSEADAPRPATQRTAAATKTATPRKTRTRAPTGAVTRKVAPKRKAAPGGRGSRARKKTAKRRARR